MYNGPQTSDWYVAPGLYKRVTVVGIGGGVSIFYFWNHENNYVYTFGYAGIGITKTSLKNLGLWGNYTENDIGDWLPVDPSVAFSPEELDGASGRVHKVGVSIMGIGYVAMVINAFRGTTTYFAGTSVDVKNTKFFSFPASVSVHGQWILLDAEEQKQTQSMDFNAFVDNL